MFEEDTAFDPHKDVFLLLFGFARLALIFAPPKHFVKRPGNLTLIDLDERHKTREISKSQIFRKLPPTSPKSFC